VPVTAERGAWWKALCREWITQTLVDTEKLAHRCLVDVHPNLKVVAAKDLKRSAKFSNQVNIDLHLSNSSEYSF
jgi:hypothetical protein